MLVLENEMREIALNVRCEMAVLRMDIAREFQTLCGPDSWTCKKLAAEAHEAAFRAYVLAQP
jgi:hypothetical protein